MKNFNDDEVVYDIINNLNGAYIGGGKNMDDIILKIYNFINSKKNMEYSYFLDCFRDEIELLYNGYNVRITRKMKSKNKNEIDISIYGI